MAASRSPGASRIAGRGSLLRTLRTLYLRVRKYGEHRAATPEERAWAAEVFDGLTAVFNTAMESEGARASLRAVEERKRISRKVPAGPPLPFEEEGYGSIGR